MNDDDKAIYLYMLAAALMLVGLVLYGEELHAEYCTDGHASYYERCFGTCETANGEWFEPDGISVAHKTLPFGTVLRVRNNNNGAVINARVNDRGPFVDGRDLDLSRGAMRRLGGLGDGVIPVTFCVMDGGGGG
jgi:rare lipoprotein A